MRKFWENSLILQISVFSIIICTIEKKVVILWTYLFHKKISSLSGKTIKIESLYSNIEILLELNMKFLLNYL